MYFSLFFMLLFISIGYAYLSATLSINGNTTIGANTWNIHFENLSITSGSVTAVTPAAIQGNTTSINYSIVLDRPGDYYEFEVDVKNDGTIPGSVSVISLSGIADEVSGILEYFVKYKKNDNSVQVGDVLNPGAKKTIIVRIAYKENPDLNSLPSDDIELNLGFDITYTQSNSLEPDSRLYYMMKKNYENGAPDIGLYTGAGSESFDNNIYYFQGNTNNNNLFFANKCWKIVRTTDTGGVKLLYNGTKSDVNGCDGANNNIGAPYHSSNNSPGFVGYMHNTETATKYAYKTKILREPYTILEATMTSKTADYYYGNSISYNGTSYQLSGDVFNGQWQNVYNNTKGKYVCRNGSDTCSTIYYVADIDPWESGTNGSNQYLLKMENGQLLADVNKTMYFSNSVNSSGLVSPTSVSLTTWLTNYADYVGKYACLDIHTSTCSEKYYVVETARDKLKYVTPNNDYMYGNSFSYSNGSYTLTTTKHFWNWQTDYNSLGNHHYTCFNTSGTCSTVYYIFYTSISKEDYDALYIELKDGKSISDALDEMLFNDNINVDNSSAKTLVDNFYANNILNTEYENYIEDTVYCNDRSVSNYGNWSPNNSNTSYGIYYSTFNNRNNPANLICPNTRDSFTVSSSIGNGALTYPIGMLTAPEAYLANKGNQAGSYLQSSVTFFTMSPSTFYIENQSAIAINTNGTYNISGLLHYGFKIRPVISLVPDVEIAGGTGSTTDPWLIY